MAYEIPGFSFTLPSAADYRTGNGQFRFVKVASSGKAQQTVAGEGAIGVRQNTPNVNEGMTIVNSGIVFLEAGGELAPGDLIASDATGRGVEAAAGNVVNATALETASAAGIIIAALLHVNGATVPSAG